MFRDNGKGKGDYYIRVYIRIIERKIETTCWGTIGVMEKNMETIIGQ